MKLDLEALYSVKTVVLRAVGTLALTRLKKDYIEHYETGYEAHRRVHDNEFDFEDASSRSMAHGLWTIALKTDLRASLYTIPLLDLVGYSAWFA